MVQHSDHNSHKRSQNENNRINDDNSHTILSNDGRSLDTKYLQTSPDGNHGTNCLFLLGTRNNNNNNNENSINKTINKRQTVGDQSCCGCICGGINKNFKEGENNGEVDLVDSPTISSFVSSSISHGRHLTHRRKSNNHDVDAAYFSFFSSPPVSFFFYIFGSSIHSANLFLWSWITDHTKKQKSNYELQRHTFEHQMHNLDHISTSSSSQRNAKVVDNEDSNNTQEDWPISSEDHSNLLLSSSSSGQSLLSNSSLSYSASSTSSSSLMYCQSGQSRNSNNINAQQNESDSSGTSTTSLSSCDKSSSIKKTCSISKKTRKRIVGNKIRTSSSDVTSHLSENAKNKKNIEISFFANSSYFPQCFLFLVCVFVFWNSLYCDFVFDDVTAIKENKDLRPHVPLKNLFKNDFWGTPMFKEQSHKSYRPLTVLTFRINYWFGGLDPLGYHLVNIILHGVVTILYFQYLKCLTSDVSISFVASLMFALHPVHTEAVTGIVGRAELLSSVWYLLALLTFARSSRKRPPHQTRWRPLLEVMLYVCLAVLCKEQGITVVGVCLCHELFVNQKLSPYILLRTIQASSSTASFVTKNNNGMTMMTTISNASNHCSPHNTFVSSTTSRQHRLRQHHSQNISKWFYYCLTRMCVLVFFTIVLLIARIKMMGGSLPVFTRFDNPSAVAPSPTKQFTYSYLFGINAWLLLSPCDLCCDWTMNTITLISSIYDPRNILTILTFLITVALIYSACSTRCESSSSPSNNNHHSILVILSLAMSIFPFLPASNLFFPVGFVVAERCLYLPSMGTCLLVSMGFHKLLSYQKHHPKLRFRNLHRFLSMLGLSIILFVFAAKTCTRNLDWKDEFSLFNSGLRVTKHNAKLYNNVGHSLEAKGDYLNALRFFDHATKIEETDIGGFMNVGRVYNQLNLFDEAETMYMKAKSLLPRSRPGEVYEARVAPNHLNVFLNLASLISKNRSRLEEADSLYRQAISMRADYTQAYINRGDILLKMNRTKEALGVYEKALSFEQDNPDLLYNMGVILLNQGNHNEALVYLDKALEHDPDHYQALLNSAILIQESGYTQLSKVAHSRLMRIVQNSKKTENINLRRSHVKNAVHDEDLRQQKSGQGVNERVYFNLGMLSMDNKDIEAAEDWFKKAVEVMPDFRSALFNLALLLSESGREMESVPFLHQLIRYHPDHVKGLILLGDFYVNHMRDLSAANNCYNRILEVEPDNIQARHNICVVMVERGQLLEARNCLKDCLKLKHEDYILKHIQIIEERLSLSATQPSINNKSVGGSEDR